MIFPFSNLMELRETGWTVFDSPSPEATLASTCALDGPVILTTHVRPRPDAKGALAMLARAQERLAQLDDQRAQDARARLTAMAKAFEEAQQPGLAKLVRDYVAQRFSKQE